MSEEKEVAESCLSIDESNPHHSSLDDVKIQRNLRQLPQQLTHNLVASRLLMNRGLPSYLCFQLDMSQQNQEDTSVSDLMKGNSGRYLPAFDQLGFNSDVSGTASLSEKNGGGRIETNTSEYYSAENGESASGNCENTETGNSKLGPDEEFKMADECGTVEKRRSSSRSSSSADEEIQTKRASLVKSKQWYSSIEYDPSRRDSIQVLAHGDSVFSEDVPPQPRRKCSRERLIKQRSQSTSDLPDLVQSSPLPSPQSPDVVPNFDSLRKRVRSEEILNTSSRESSIELMNETFERKQEIEGIVHDGTGRRPSYRRSVSFQESPTVYSIPGQDRPDGNESDVDKTPVSPHGEVGRQHFRELKDSGYRTGSSSKGSLQSQLSDQTNFSDSVLTDTSVDKEDGEENFENSHHSEENLATMTNYEEGPSFVPLLSIFRSGTEGIQSIQKQPSVSSKSLHVDGLGDNQNSGNMPHLSIFNANSDGSLCLKSNEFSSSLGAAQATGETGLGGEDMSSDLTREAEDSPVGLHDKYAEEILEAKIEQGACACPPHSGCELLEKKSLPKERGLHQEPSRQLYEHFISKSELDDQALNALLEKLAKLPLFPSDSSTPSPSPHDKSLLASIMEQFSYTPTEKKGDSLCYTVPDFPGVPDKQEVVINEKLDMLREGLERASRCQYNKCDDPDCKKAKALLQGFDGSIQSYSTLDKDQESVLVALRCHSERCEDLKCPAPYCSLLYKINPWDRNEAICQIRHKLDIILDITDEELNPGKFLPLSPEFQHAGPMKEWEDWMAISPLGYSRNVVLIDDMNLKRNCVLKKVPLLEENHQWFVYEQLRGLTHANLVQHLWVMEHGRDLLICTQFMGDGSLRHKLQESTPNLPWPRVVSYMQQIIVGVMELHRMGIVYINWTSCNILLDNGGKCAKVSNLAMSVKLGQQNVDYGGIKNTLPPAILPPELLASSPCIERVSDSWGCGCLLYELLLGRKVWYQYRHETKDFIWRKLQDKVPPYPKELNKWPEVFQACWQHNLQRRHPLENISRLLTVTLSSSRS